MCAGARARAGVLLVSTLCVCRGQGYGWSIPSEFCVCVCVCWGQGYGWSIANEFCVCVCVCAGARVRAGVLLVSTLCVCVCVCVC